MDCVWLRDEVAAGLARPKLQAFARPGMYRFIHYTWRGRLTAATRLLSRRNPGNSPETTAARRARAT